MPVFHSLMQQFLAAESDSKPSLWKIGFIVFKPLLYKHSELLGSNADRPIERGRCKADEWTIYKLAV